MNPAIKISFELEGINGAMPDNIAAGSKSVFQLGDDESIRIGRSKTADVIVSDSSVGRLAVEIKHENRQLVIADLGSGGGSRLITDGQEFARPNRALPNDCELWIGNVLFNVGIVG